jgi:serine/threonine-protein kinase RsbW
MRAAETMSVPGTTAGVAQAVQAFEGFCRTHALPPQARWRFLVALDEILSNIVRHGSGDAPIGLTFSVERGTVGLDVVDRAAAFNPLLVPEPDTSAPLDRREPGGLGLALVRRLMDEVRYERRENQNCLSMRWREPQGAVRPETRTPDGNH